MTTPESDPPQRGIEYPPLENVPPAVDPYAPVDYPEPSQYPPGYGGWLPPPVYPGAYPPPYPGQFAYDPYRPVVPSGTNGKAIAALVTAVIGLPACMCFLPSLIGIILGIIAMTETKRTGQAGYGLALAGVLVGAATVFFGIGFMVTSN